MGPSVILFTILAVLPNSSFSCANDRVMKTEMLKMRKKKKAEVGASEKRAPEH